MPFWYQNFIISRFCKVLERSTCNRNGFYVRENNEFYVGSDINKWKKIKIMACL